MTAFDRDPDMRALVAELRVTIPPDGATLARVRERVAVSLTAAAAALPSEGGPSSPTPGSGIAWLGAPKLALAATLALGAVLGAAGYALVRPPVERIVYRDRVVAVAPSAASAATSSFLDQSAATNPTVTSRARAAPSSAAGTGPTGTAPEAPDEAPGLAAELRLLERTRTALSRGDVKAALAGVELHAERYPDGVLVQERDALRVKALVAAGRGAEARLRSQLFAEVYPGSPLLESVRSAVAAIP